MTTQTTDTKNGTAPHPSMLEATLDITDVDESPINPRKHFNGIDELAKNVAVHGILQRLLVRPVPGPDDAAPYQIVFGARRYRAAVKAGLKKIPVTIRELDDAHAFELMVVENCQREDVHPLEEAEGYERMNRDFGYSVDDIAGKVHKSRSAIYARMKLCALCPEAHKAFFADKFTAETALAIARIPSPVLQKDAIKQLESAGWEGERVSTRRAFQIIQGRYMLRLDAAPFKTTDETLVPAAGSCAKCPKRTGNQPELFADVKSKDTCSDPDCYKSKVVATTAQKVKELESKGGTVLTEKETKKLFPYGEGSMSVAEGASYFPLDNSCHEDPKGRSYRALLKGKAVKLVGAVHSTKGLVELVSRAEAAKLLKGLDLRSHAAQAGSFGAAEKKRRDAGILRNAVSMLALAEIVSAAEKKKPDPKFWNAITPLLIKSLPHECAKAIVKRRELGVVHDSFAFEKVLMKTCSSMKDDERRGLAVEIVASTGAFFSYGDGLGEGIKACSALYGVKLSKLEAEAKKRLKRPLIRWTGMKGKGKKGRTYTITKSSHGFWFETQNAGGSAGKTLDEAKAHCQEHEDSKADK